MADLKRSELRAIENAMAFLRGFGDMLNFPHPTFDEFFHDEFGIEIDSEQFIVDGRSKRKRLLTYLR